MNKSTERYVEVRRKSPKIDQLYACLKYTSPVDCSDENTIIDEIRHMGSSMGQQLYKDGWQNSSIMSLHQQNQSTGSEHLQHDQDYVKCRNLYDKYPNHRSNIKTQQIIKQKTQQIKHQNHPSKQNNQKYKNVQSKFKNDTDCSVLNYKRYIKKVIDKKIEQQKNNKATKSQHKIIQSKKVLQRVIQQGDRMLDKKASRVQQIRQQNLRKQISTTTFRPKIRVNWYNQQTNYLNQTIKLKKFTQRQNVSKMLRQNKQHFIINEELKKNSFKPKILKDTKLELQMHNSINKINQLNRSQHKKSNAHFDKTDNKSMWDDSLNEDTTETNGVAVKSLKQLNFLLH